MRRAKPLVAALLVAAACSPSPKGTTSATPEGGITLVTDDHALGASGSGLPWTHIEGQGTVSPDGTSFNGTVSYFTEQDGETVCDVDETLSGTEYTGDCEGCVYAFNIAPTVTRDDSSASCVLNPFWTYQPTDTIKNLGWAYADKIPSLFDADYYYYNVVATLFSVDISDYYYYARRPSSYYYYPGPYYYPFTFLAGYGFYADVEHTGDDFTWSVYWNPTYSSYYYPYKSEFYYDTSCTTDDRAYSPTYPDGESYSGYSGYGEVDCGGDLVDGWAFSAQAGDHLSLSVDTVASDSAFDPVFYVDSGDRCTLINADDSFACSYAPTRHACPSATLDAAETGLYWVYVYSKGSCTGDVADYKISLARD